MRKIIASVLMAVMGFIYIIFECPLSRLIAWIYPESTEHIMKIWLDDKKEKVRFCLSSSPWKSDVKNSCGMRISQWNLIVTEINKKLEAK